MNPSTNKIAHETILKFKPSPAKVKVQHRLANFATGKKDRLRKTSTPSTIDGCWRSENRIRTEDVLFDRVIALECKG